MKTEFKFSNLLGTVYRKGNLLFTPDGTCLLSPVGNRVTVFDLVNDKSYTLPFAHRKNICRIALSASGNLLLSIDDDGRAVLSSYPRRLAIYHFSFRTAVSALAFSPSGRHFAVGIGRDVEIWHAPSTPGTTTDGLFEFAPFVRHRVLTGHFDVVRSIEWSSDSRFLLSGSRDLTARIWSLNPEEGFVPTALGGHRDAVVEAWFSRDQEKIYTLSQDGALFQRVYASESRHDEVGRAFKSGAEAEPQWRITKRHYFLQNNAKVNCAAFHSGSDLLVTGFSNGVFGIYDLPECSLVQTLSISQSNIDFVSINRTGEWLAFGAAKLGQLLVWEWQSESYILKQQGHHDSINSLVYTPDSQRIITTADDGKLKVWDTNSGFCIVTFTEHTGGVTACQFAKKGNVLFSASLDGSIRAWDLTRYRNFKTFTAPTRLSFTSLAADPSGEVICGGSLDSFEIHVWSVQTGQLLDQLAGHEGPVSCLAFAPNGGVLVSGSWDHTVRIWSIFTRTQTSEPLQLQADVLCVAYRPDSNQIAVSTLDGQLAFWSVSEASQENAVNGRPDASGGRKLTDRRTAANASGNKSFTTVTYSTDGTCVLAGGNTKYICLYDVQSCNLIKKFTVSVNLSFDGTQEFLNSRNLTEAGPAALLNDGGDASDVENRMNRTLPGTTRGAASYMNGRPEIRVPAVAFSPAGQAFCAATTEGLLIYSLDNVLQFDPFDLDIMVTPSTTLQTLAEYDYVKAIVMAFRLNERAIIRKVYEGIPVADIALVVKRLPTLYIARLIRFVAHATEETPHLEFNLLWIKAILSIHGGFLRDNAGGLGAELRLLHRAIGKIQAELATMADENIYTLDYMLSQSTLRSDGVGMVRVMSEPIHDSNSLDSDALDDDWIGFGDTESSWLGAPTMLPSGRRLVA